MITSTCRRVQCSILAFLRDLSRTSVPRFRHQLDVPMYPRQKASLPRPAVLVLSDSSLTEEPEAPVFTVPHLQAPQKQHISHDEIRGEYRIQSDPAAPHHPQSMSRTRA